jgi:hypothetical protein
LEVCSNIDSSKRNRRGGAAAADVPQGRGRPLNRASGAVNPGLAPQRAPRPDSPTGRGRNPSLPGPMTRLRSGALVAGPSPILANSESEGEEEDDAEPGADDEGRIQSLF